jgi:hypothetical protein
MTDLFDLAMEAHGGELTDTSVDAAICGDVDVIVAIVALALILDGNRPLQIELRQLSGVGENDALSLQLPWPSSVIKLLPNGGASAHRVPKGLLANLNSFFLAHESIRAAIEAGRVSAAAMARKIVLPFFTPRQRLPSRAEFEALYRWAPLFEKLAYSLCARSINLLESWRTSALREGNVTPATGSTVERYYALLHTMTHLTLLASSPGARPWLSDMAKSFPWVNWTPTFALVRERTVWVAAAAARSAAEFGIDVLPFYFQALAEARHPMKAFDALVGLVAIACAEDDAFEPIVEGISRQEQEMHNHPMPGQEYADLAYRTAAASLRTWADGLESPKHILARLGWSVDGRAGLATREALALDPTDFGTTGEMIGLAALPTVMRSPLSHHFPVHSGGTHGLLPRRGRMRLMLHQAWWPRTGSSDMPQ